MITMRKPYRKKLVQTLNFNGEINITKKWKVGFRSGYDFEQGKTDLYIT